MLIDSKVHTKEDEQRIVGCSLQEAREERGLSLKQVEQVIAIHPHHLEALERGDYGAFPDPLWARGSLILYAGHLGMEGERLADKLFPRQHPSVPVRYFRRHWRAILAVLSTIALVAVIATATIITPYNPVTRGVSDALQAVAPNVFLGSEPQNIAVLGIADGVADEPSGVLVVRVAEGGLDLTAIPPDTSSEIPGHGRGHIGEAINIGGPDLMRQTVGRVTNTEVQFFCLIGLDGIKEIVHSANGIVIDVPRATSGRTFPGGPLLTLRPGQQTLDGDQAVVYLQGNDLLTDEERAKRQQRFLYAMFRQALAPSNLLTNPAALGTWSDNVETNMSSVQMVQLAGRIRELKNSDVSLETHTISNQQEAPSAQ